MKVFTGDACGYKTLRVLKEAKIGRVFIRGPRKLYDGEEWMFDNGAYSWFTEAKKAGKNGNPFRKDLFLRRLERCYETLPYPYLAVLPDIVAGGDESWDFSMQWLNSGKLPAEWPWYLAVQDGMDTASVVNVMDCVSGIFLGGSDEYKKQALFWRKVTSRFSKPLHYARTGTLGKIAHATMVAADSIDSSFPLWTYQRLYSFIDCLSQQFLWVPEDYIMLQKNPRCGDGAYTSPRDPHEYRKLIMEKPHD